MPRRRRRLATFSTTSAAITASTASARTPPANRGSRLIPALTPAVNPFRSSAGPISSGSANPARPPAITATAISGISSKTSRPRPWPADRPRVRRRDSVRPRVGAPVSTASATAVSDSTAAAIMPAMKVKVSAPSTPRFSSPWRYESRVSTVDGTGSCQSSTALPVSRRAASRCPAFAASRSCPASKPSPSTRIRFGLTGWKLGIDMACCGSTMKSSVVAASPGTWSSTWAIVNL